MTCDIYKNSARKMGFVPSSDNQANCTGDHFQSNSDCKVNVDVSIEFGYEKVESIVKQKQRKPTVLTLVSKSNCSAFFGVVYHRMVSPME